ncbi:MAG: hypothetical protein ACRDKI_01730 [Solirubrobacterales bacterium]
MTSDQTFSSSVPRIPAIRPAGFELCVTFDLRGMDWAYVNELHHSYRFDLEWPAGMLCHFTGPNETGIVSRGIWTTREAEAEYFNNIAAEVITNSVNEIGPPQTDSGAGDFEPVPRALHRLTLGRDFAAFVGIGEDIDASAIHALGNQPVVIEFDHTGIPPGDFDMTMQQIGYDVVIPQGMIMQCVERGEEDFLETQVWSDATSARLALQSEYLPALARHTGGNAVAAIKPQIHELRRISFGADEVDPAWLA